MVAVKGRLRMEVQNLRVFYPPPTRGIEQQISIHPLYYYSSNIVVVRQSEETYKAYFITYIYWKRVCSITYDARQLELGGLISNTVQDWSSSCHLSPIFFVTTPMSLYALTTLSRSSSARATISRASFTRCSRSMCFTWG